jgi:pre-mRNA-processing factor 19
MSFTCEISGQPLSGVTDDDIVVTPSGHVCLKRLLLTKLTENGGMDPFETIRERPLSEDQLVTLSASAATRMHKSVPPPRPSVTSLPALLQLLQQEYDAIMLELFDTRKELQETRRELSQALYQNDAAVRVVARLSMERDTARQELEQWKASTGGGGVGIAMTATAAATANGKHELSTAGTATTATVDDDEEEEEPEKKRRRVKEQEAALVLPLANDIPGTDLDQMVAAWERLHKVRKPMLKASGSKAPSPEELSKEYQPSMDTKAWHKSTCKSISAMAQSGNFIITAGKDKQLMVYHSVSKVVLHTQSMGNRSPSQVDILELQGGGFLVAAATDTGYLAVFEASSGESDATMTKVGDVALDDKSVIVNVALHPSQQHVCLATASGKLIVCAIRRVEKVIEQVTHFAAAASGDGPVSYSSGALHPDGLIYAAGTPQGDVHIWDFKNKVLASTLKSQVRTVSFIRPFVPNQSFGFALLAVFWVERFAWPGSAATTAAIVRGAL